MDVWFFLHVGGAMVLVGAMLLSATALVGAWRADDAGNLRLGYRALLVGALPAYLVMRVAAQLLVGDDQYKAAEDNEEAWIGIGYGTSELGLLLLIIATVLAGISVKRSSGGGRVKAATVLIGLTLVIYLITIWAMTTKPT